MSGPCGLGLEKRRLRNVVFAMLGQELFLDIDSI